MKSLKQRILRLRLNSSALPGSCYLALVLLPLFFSGPLSAEDLYKWREADGSLTFSPKPPPKSSGISFEKITAPDSTANANAAELLSNITDTSEVSNETLPSVAPLQSVNPVSQSTQSLVVTGTEADVPAVASAMASERPVLTQPLNELSQTTPSSMSRKSEHCNELRKRVMSLEQLLTTKISAATMDNAVIQMAMYQNSFNQSCQGIARHSR